MCPIPSASLPLNLTDLPELSDLLLELGKVRLRIVSRSMVPTLRPGDEILVEPVRVDAPRPGDLILFKHEGHLICHRLVEVSNGMLLTQGDAPGTVGRWIGRDQAVGKVAEIRKRSAKVALTQALQHAFAPRFLRYLAQIQQFKTYRVLLRPLLIPTVSYHLGLAHGSRWYDWQELRPDGDLPVLPHSVRPHLLIAKRGKDMVGWTTLCEKNAGWQSENLYVRIRYRGLGLESNLAHLAARLITDQ